MLTSFMQRTSGEWALVRQLRQFDAVIAEVEEELLPNRLCSDPFELSQVFNRFYDQVPVLKADGPARCSRMALCRPSADTLKLGLLGIPSLERMGGGVEEFRLRLLGYQAGILPNPCFRVLHGLATVGLTFELSWQRRWRCQALAADNVQVTYGPGLVDRRWGSI